MAPWARQHQAASKRHEILLFTTGPGPAPLVNSGIRDLGPQAGLLDRMFPGFVSGVSLTLRPDIAEGTQENLL